MVVMRCKHPWGALVNIYPAGWGAASKRFCLTSSLGAVCLSKYRRLLQHRLTLAVERFCLNTVSRWKPNRGWVRSAIRPSRCRFAAVDVGQAEQGFPNIPAGQSVDLNVQMSVSRSETLLTLSVQIGRNGGAFAGATGLKLWCEPSTSCLSVSWEGQQADDLPLVFVVLVLVTARHISVFRSSSVFIRPPRLFTNYNVAFVLATFPWTFPSLFTGDSVGFNVECKLALNLDRWSLLAPILHPLMLTC